MLTILLIVICVITISIVILLLILNVFKTTIETKTGSMSKLALNPSKRNSESCLSIKNEFDPVLKPVVEVAATSSKSISKQDMSKCVPQVTSNMPTSFSKIPFTSEKSKLFKKLVSEKLKAMSNSAKSKSVIRPKIAPNKSMPRIRIMAKKSNFWDNKSVVNLDPKMKRSVSSNSMMDNSCSSFLSKYSDTSLGENSKKSLFKGT